MNVKIVDLWTASKRKDDLFIKIISLWIKSN